MHDMFKVRVTISAEIRLNSEDPEAVRRQIESSFQRAIGDGALTGHTDGECESYELKIEEVS